MSCIKTIFEQLPRESLMSIKSVCTSASSALSALKVQKQAMMSSMDISLAPLQAKKAALDAAIAGLREKTHVISTDLVLQCPEVGAINTLLESALVGSLENISNITFDINRLMALKVSISAEMSQIDSASSFFNEVVSVVGEVLA